jgi:transposase
MENLRVSRLDHLGIISGIIDDLGLVQAIDTRLQRDKNGLEEISPGEAIKGMILNGLGFVSKPLSLTPLFFQNKPLELLFRAGVKADDFNRFKLGRTLDQIFDYGTDKLFSELSFDVCIREGVDQRFNSEDTTTFSVTGESYPDSDEQAVSVTHGYSKDHRPDLKQVVHELMVSQDGGVPLLMKTWSGNESDSVIFRERTQALIEQFNRSSVARYLIADSKLYDSGNAPNLSSLRFITRIPSTLKQEREVISEALTWDNWQRIDDDHHYSCKVLTHYDMEQRWLIVRSKGALMRVEKTISKRVLKEHNELAVRLKKLSATPFACKEDAALAFKKENKGIRYHDIELVSINEMYHYENKGRPKKESLPQRVNYHLETAVKRNDQAIKSAKEQGSCYVVGTNIPANELSNQDVILAYKGQNTSIENKGFRFLKDALFFTSSLFIKKPSRIMGLLFIMTLSLLVYSIAQRRMRNKLAEQNEVLPNQISLPSKQPTLRWVFQLMEGISLVEIVINGVQKLLIDGLCDLKRKIISLFGKNVEDIYLQPTGLGAS